MATRIDVHLCVVSTGGGNTVSVGNLFQPSVLTGSASQSADQRTLQATAGTALEVYSAASSSFQVLYVLPASAGTLAIQNTVAGGATPTWALIELAAGVPFILPTNAATTNTSAQAQAGDTGGNEPTGVTDGGKLAGVVNRVLFYAAADGQVTVGRFS